MRRLNRTHLLTTAGLLAALALPVSAVTQGASVPNSFESGDLIEAEAMNDNFDALVDAIDGISLTPGPQGDPGPVGPPGPSGKFSIRDAGTYAGMVGEGELGDFSALTGAGGATGTAAADAACDSAYLGSHAELDMLVLWSAAANGRFPTEDLPQQYWASTVLDFPLYTGGDNIQRSGDCADWTDASGQSYTGTIGVNYGGWGPGTFEANLYMAQCSTTYIAVACFMNEEPN